MRSQFSQFMEASPEAIIVLDSDGRIHDVNLPAAAMFGYDRHRLRGHPVDELLPDQPEAAVRVDRRAEQGRAAPRQDVIGLRGDASRFPAEIQVVPIRTRQGAMAVVTVRDLTDAQRAQLSFERTVEVLHVSNRDRQLLLGQLVAAQEEERKRIAAGIHDDTIQTLTAVHFRVQQLEHRLRDPDELEIVSKLEDVLQASLSRLRELIFELRPTKLEEGHLAAALRTYLDEMRSLTGIAYELDYQLPSELPLDTSVIIYRTAQEALLNVRKHARATKVVVTLTELDGGCLVQITDNGIGYDPVDVENTPGHLGLALMRERPRLAGGFCGIESAPGGGTAVEFWVPTGPLHSPAESAA